MAVDIEQPMSAQEVYEEGRRLRRAPDSFDAWIAGWAELVASGQFEEADRAAMVVFENFEGYRRTHPEWADRYAAA